MCVDLWMFFFSKQKTAYEMRISDWSSDVCSSDLSDALVEPQPHQQRFGRAGARGERFLAFDAVAVARQCGEPVFGLAPPEGRTSAAPPVRARADAQIIAIAPIGQVVPALGARSRVVRDFVRWSDRKSTRLNSSH